MPDIIENDGKKYIKADHMANYIKKIVEGVQTKQNEIDTANAELEEIKAEEIEEQRTKQAEELIDKHRLDPSSLALVDVSNEEAFTASMHYLLAAAQSEYGDATMYFEKKTAIKDGKKERYEYGRQLFHRQPRR